MAKSKNFVTRVQATPKMKRIKAKIRKANLLRKKLAKEYKRTLKQESKRLSK